MNEHEHAPPTIHFRENNMAALRRSRGLSVDSRKSSDSEQFPGENEILFNLSDTDNESESDDTSSLCESDSDLDDIVETAANHILGNHTTDTQSHTRSSSSTNVVETEKSNDVDEEGSGDEDDIVCLPFVIDSKPSGGKDDKEDGDNSGNDGDDTSDDVSEAIINMTGQVMTSRHDTVDLSSSIDPGMDVGDIYINLDDSKPENSKQAVQNILLRSKHDELLKKSVVTAGFEKKDSVPPYKESQHQLRHQRKRERESHTGKNWYNMKAAEMTDELKNDLKVMQMRGTLDPKRFYKKNDVVGLPKFVQVGRVIEHAADFYHSRIPKKERKKTIVDELLADAEFRRYNKRKYAEVQEATKQRSGSRRHMKRMKKKNR
ncbi:uncharacterized protein LOC144441159 [Glandiceps talaboti]